MTSPVLAGRRRQREALLSRARLWAAELAERMPTQAVVVIGSVARGDFNKWSDLDVLVIADDLPAGGRDRLDLLHPGAPAGLQPVGWTPAELDERTGRRDPLAVEARLVGVVVYGALPPAPASR